MCGGVGFKIKNIPEVELKKYYSPELLRRFQTIGQIESFFWQKPAVLPVRTKKGTQLMLWGNKDQQVNLPLTGWAKEESLKQGKWAYLKPKLVKIPVAAGYEKKIWFDLPQGTEGVVVKKDKNERVYMITKQASDQYQKQTGHGREPLGEKKNYQPELGKRKLF